ncbi:MAG: glycosyltransferase [Planctomycetaceae bacterium]
MMKPTICQVVHSLHVGGAELLVTELSRVLRDRYRIVIACLDDGGPLADQLRDEGHVVEVLDRRSGVDWQCGRRLARFLREQNVAAIHAHQYTPFFYSLLARGLGRQPPIVFTEHGRQHPDHPRLKRIVCNRLLLRSCDRVIAVGEAVRRALIANEGIRPSRVEVLFNGVRLDSYRSAANDPALRAAVRRELGLSDTDFVIAQVARLNELKDHTTAARAIGRLHNRLASGVESAQRHSLCEPNALASGDSPSLRHPPRPVASAIGSQRDHRGADADSLADDPPNVRWLVIGDGEQRATLEAAVRDNNIGEVTQLLGTRRDVPRLLAAADVCLLSSISEGIPLTLIEAMAARLPVVSTDVGGVAEVVVPEFTGLLAPAGDDAQLANQLARLAADRALAARWGDNGAARAEKLFSFEQMADGYARVFEEVVCNVEFKPAVSTPKELRHIAQGCPLRATLGEKTREALYPERIAAFETTLMTEPRWGTRDD